MYDISEEHVLKRALNRNDGIVVIITSAKGYSTLAHV
jgi:hypothetical protein